MDKLHVVIPAYNEEVNIEKVAREWHSIIENIGGDSKLVIIDDGSKDNTYKILCNLKRQLPYLEPLTKYNGGHGSTVLYGYNFALDNKADFIFQTDSDGQTLPSEFWRFWEQRREYRVLIGHRRRRQDGIFRVFVTNVLKFIIWYVFRLNVTDANTPFRLMNGVTLKRHIVRIPKDCTLPNVMLTVLFISSMEKVKFLPITFRARQGGKNSINLKRIVAIGKKSMCEFITIKRSMKNPSSAEAS